IYDGWSQTPTTPRSMLPHYGGGIESALGQADGQTLLDAGCSYDLISDRQLRSVVYSDGSLQTGGASYKAIILPETRFLQPETFERLITLAREGATIIALKSLPSDVPGWGDLERRRNSLKALIAELPFNKNASLNGQIAKVGRGSFWLGDDLKRMIVAMVSIKREPMVSQGVRFIRRKDGSSQYYFVVNQGDRAVDGWVALGSYLKSVAIFDPMREETGIAAMRRVESGGVEVYLQLAPGESRILKTFDKPVNGPSYAYFNTAGAPQPLNGKWSLPFGAGGPELPSAVETDRLGSWTDFDGEAYKRFSGTGVYTISFAAPQGRVGDWTLDLGRVAESARVKLNGNELGVLINAPYRIRIPKELLKEQNTLQVAVSNLITNRIIDLDRRGVNWKRFYNTNMPA